MTNKNNTNFQIFLSTILLKWHRTTNLRFPNSYRHEKEHAIYENQGYDAYLVPQDPTLPMANRREDILIIRP